MKISGKTEVACLIGHPVAHSFSPYIHNYLAEKYKLDMKYVCYDVEMEQVENAISGIRALGIIGSNVTIPHKVEVMSCLDEIDYNARIIGAVNTIKNENGKLIGYNTDGRGFVKSVLDQGHILKGKNVMVLGAGGASKAVVTELAASGIAMIQICNKTVKKAEELGAKIAESFKEVEIISRDIDIREADLENIDFLINTTPLGMSSQKELCPIDESIVPHEGLVVCDIVYTPHKTKFLKWALKHNLEVVYGIGMLINQALESFSLWTGIEVDAYEEVLEILVREGIINMK